ncbi:sensor histidine kinase [Streptomyces sp. NPDC087420]|uniref:sensor histidine kinase n=1 Tax=Streptomyces sp. NPDC087420 TaxID=3365785 RepID=UPI0038358110
MERAEQLQREQPLIADHARLRERTRIAQDMHDVLGHDLSLIALSAGALKLAPGLEEHHRKAAGDLRARAAAAVERLGEVIGVLREETGNTPAHAGGSSLTGLTSEASAAGLAVKLRVDGRADELPAMIERAVHWVVQEALTNIAKHAPGATATVHVTHTAKETCVVVGGTARPRPLPPARRPGPGAGGVASSVSKNVSGWPAVPSTTVRATEATQSSHGSRTRPRPHRSRPPAVVSCRRNIAMPGAASAGPWSPRSWCPW